MNLDPDLQELMDKNDAEYRAVALRNVKEGLFWTPRLAQLLDQQDDILRIQWARDDRRMGLQMIAIAILLLLAGIAAVMSS